jgi:hypothetical protein
VHTHAVAVRRDWQTLVRYVRDVDPRAIRCEECHREVDEFTALAGRWGYWSDGCALLPFCPEFAKREFAPTLPRAGSSPDAYPSGRFSREDDSAYDSTTPMGTWEPIEAAATAAKRAAATIACFPPVDEDASGRRNLRLP